MPKCLFFLLYPTNIGVIAFYLPVSGTGNCHINFYNPSAGSGNCHINFYNPSAGSGNCHINFCNPSAGTGNCHINFCNPSARPGNCPTDFYMPVAICPNGSFYLLNNDFFVKTPVVFCLNPDKIKAFCIFS